MSVYISHSKMKLVVALLVSMMVVAHAEQAKRQLAMALAAAEPVLAKLLVDKLCIDKLIGKFVGNVAAFFNGKSGTIPLDGTQITLSYNIHKCSIHFGKRFLIKHIAEQQCKAEVCENKITKTCQSCTKGDQSGALQCAMKAEVTAIQKLAQQAAAQKQS